MKNTTNKKITVEVTDRNKLITEITYLATEEKIPVVQIDGKLCLTDAGDKIPRLLFYGSLSPVENTKSGKVAYCEYMIVRYQNELKATLYTPTEEESLEMEIEKLTKKADETRKKIEALKKAKQAQA